MQCKLRARNGKSSQWIAGNNFAMRWSSLRAKAKECGWLEDALVNVLGRIPIKILANPFNTNYLNVKKNKSGHILC